MTSALVRRAQNLMSFSVRLAEYLQSTTKYFTKNAYMVIIVNHQLMRSITMGKLNRISLFVFGTFLFACAGNLHAQQAMSLDELIEQTAKDMEARLPAGAKLAMLNFTSTAEAFSDYVIEELSGALVMNSKVTVIERKSLDLIRREMNLQLSGDIGDDLAQTIGKQLGAQAVVTGSLTNLGDTYRFRVKVINVETARIEAQFSYNLGNNQQVAFLLNANQQNVPPIDPVQGQADPISSQTTKTYKVGDTGPAGGIVFYDKGVYVDGWRYLEAASENIGSGTPWDVNNRSVNGTGTVVGTGKRNTEIMTEAGITVGLIVRQYSQGGYSDWFLPSKDELDFMYRNLKHAELGNFDDGQYWSSSVYSGSLAWAQNFSDGSQLPPHMDTRSVRAVRAF
jgi:TolB-like protein